VKYDWYVIYIQAIKQSNIWQSRQLQARYYSQKEKDEWDIVTQNS
jgi:hypothetical protein